MILANDGVDRHAQGRAAFAAVHFSRVNRKHIQVADLPEISRTASQLCTAPSFAVALCDRMLTGSMSLRQCRRRHGQLLRVGEKHHPHALRPDVAAAAPA